MKVSVYYCRLFNVVIIILIGVACSAFCALLTLPYLGIHPITIYSHKKSRRYSESTYPYTLHVYCNFCLIHVNGYSQQSLDLYTFNSNQFTPAHDGSTPHQTVTELVHRSSSLSIEYLSVFVIVAVFLWLQNEMGLNLDIVECHSYVTNEVCNCYAYSYSYCNLSNRFYSFTVNHYIQ